LNNPINYVDPDGRSPILAILYALFEAGMSAYDTYVTVNTLFFDENATSYDKSLSVVGLSIGLVAPGGGYGKIAKEGAKLIIEQTIKRSGNLRRSLGVTKANMHLYKGMKAHHLIPVDLLKKNKVVKDAVLAGFDFNGKKNGLLVQAGKDKHSRHDGYTNAIEKEINQFVVDNPKYKPKDAKEFLEDLADRASKTIEKNGSVNKTTKID